MLLGLNVWGALQYLETELAYELTRLSLWVNIRERETLDPYANESQYQLVFICLRKIFEVPHPKSVCTVIGATLRWKLSL